MFSFMKKIIVSVKEFLFGKTSNIILIDEKTTTFQDIMKQMDQEKNTFNRLVELEKLVFRLASVVDAQTRAINKQTETMNRQTETIVQYNTLFEELMNLLDGNPATAADSSRHSSHSNQNSSSGDTVSSVAGKKRHLN